MSVKEIRITDEYTNFIVSDVSSTQALKEGNTEPLYNKRTIFTKDYTQKLFERTKEASYILPPNIRYMQPLETGSLVIVEEPPALRTIFVRFSIGGEIKRAKGKKCLELYDPDKTYRNNMDLRSEKTKYHSFTLAMPYVIHFLNFGKTYQFQGGSVFFRKNQMRGFADVLYKAPLMNINDGQNVCYGSGPDFGTKLSLNLAVENVLNGWWSSVYNTDYTYNYNEYISKGIEGLTSYMEWQYYSKQNPLFIYDIPWILHENNVSDQLERSKKYYHGHKDINRGLHAFTSVMTVPIATGKTAKIGKRVKKEKPLAKDICQSTMAYDDNKQEYPLEVGFQFKNKKGDPITIDCFNGILNTGIITSVQLDRNGKCETWKVNKKVWNYIIQSHRTLNYEDSTMLNGVKVKTGDIISLQDPIYKVKSYRRVGLIRQGRSHDKREIQLSGNYYFEDKIKDVALMSLDAPEYNGIKLKVGEEYIGVFQEDGMAGVLLRASFIQYKNVDIDSSGKIIFAFEDRMREPYNIRSENPNSSLYKQKDLRPITTFPFYSGFSLYCPRSSSSKPEDYLYTHSGRIISDMRFNYRAMSPDYSGYTENLITKDRFFISGPTDQEYTIGETVIHVNFRDPVETLRVKRITSFIRNKENGNIDFLLEDKNGKMTTHNYIDASKGKIFTGSIRKIVSNINDIYAGTKIVPKAKESGIPGYTKKSVNIIIGFITDTGGEPMVLCSNCTTLWFSDLIEKFELHKFDSKEWKTLEHMPIELSKIKAQPGDLLNGDGVYTGVGNYYLAFLQDYSRMRFIPDAFVNSPNVYPDSYTFDKYTEGHTLFSGLPAPRVSKSTELFSGIPNMFGLIHEVPQSPFKFPEELRRI